MNSNFLRKRTKADKRRQYQKLQEEYLAVRDGKNGLYKQVKTNFMNSNKKLS